MTRSLKVAYYLFSIAFLQWLFISAGFAGRQQRVDLDTLKIPRYSVDGDAFVIHNGNYFCNRPLYCNHIYAVAFAGDKPYEMLGDHNTVCGNLIFGLIRAGKATWLLNASDVTSKYRPGRMEWMVKDASWGSTEVVLEEVPDAQGPGLATHLRMENALPGDQIIWASGGAMQDQKSGVLWTYDMTSQHVPYMTRGFSVEDCLQNEVQIKQNKWTLKAADSPQMTMGLCSKEARIILADASKWKDPMALLSSHGGGQPMACGVVPVSTGEDLYWSLESGGNSEGKSPQEVFVAGKQRVEELENEITIETPDPWLNASVKASVIAQDACFREGIYTHSGMRWGVPLLGWRTLFGATAYGWHNNVKTDAKIFIDAQIKESSFTEPKADLEMKMASQAPDSRMFGKGRIDLHNPHHYDMQSQFFDQVEHAWRWTGDPDLEKLLRSSLDLHCEYIKDCFDPSGIGIYESYANTWPTDDQWYNGGGTSEETAYAYRSELTALQLAQRADDKPGIKLHETNLARIRKGFFDLLWIPERGYPGAYREQIGLKRLHESCWLYAIFCPIDAGLLDTEQSAQALQYTEWGLERVKMPYGGEQCWPSNWVPSIWSVREMWSGDNYHLALAYFQTGLADDGWNLLRGTFPQQALFGPVPADMGHPAGGTDFNDCNSMFARAVVEGLFGFRPDYTKGIVTFAPQFPSGWDHASIKTADMSVSYKSAGSSSSYQFNLTQPAAMELHLPVVTNGVRSVTVDGSPVSWKVLPGYGQSIVEIELPTTKMVSVVIECQDHLKPLPSISISGKTGNAIKLQVENIKLIDFHDPQGVLKGGKILDGNIVGTFTSNAGDHIIFGLAQKGTTTFWQMFKIHVTNVEAEALEREKTDITVPPNPDWKEIDLASVLNGDIRTIYQQQYLSPRPNTCSLRLATNGYSSWQMVLGKTPKPPPTIDLANMNTLRDGKGRLIAGKGIPFMWPSGKANIAFTSTWDNWPKEIEVPVNKSGDAIWFLLCGTTNPMEVRIANAVLQMKYRDGVMEELPIVPPFNFWTLCPFGADYDYKRDGFSLPAVPPTTVQLGNNCRANVLGWRLRPNVPLESVTLKTQSQEVVIGLMGLTVMKSSSGNKE